MTALTFCAKPSRTSAAADEASAPKEAILSGRQKKSPLGAVAAYTPHAPTPFWVVGGLVLERQELVLVYEAVQVLEEAWAVV